MSKWLDEDDVKHVLASEAFLKVLEEYGDLKPSKDSWLMLCPFHDERNPSFSTNFGSGIYIYHCFGCLKSGTSITFLKEKENLKYVEAIERLARKINYPLRKNGKTTASSNQRSRVPLPDKYYYTYQDAEGQPLFRMGKQLTDTGKRFWSEVFVEPGQWRPGSIDQDKRPLFKLPAVLKAIASEETIYVVEGEKDVLAFEKKYGKVATTNPNGAGRWLEHHTETLVGAKKVVIIIDRDQVGLNHGLNIFADLKRHGVNVFICSPVSSCNDISDHFNAGYGLKDLVLLAAKELMVSKKLNALDELHPEYSQKWSKIIEEAEFEEVEGVRLNAGEKAKENERVDAFTSDLADARSRPKRQKKGLLELIRGDLEHHYGIDFCLIQAGSHFMAEAESALFLEKHFGWKLMSNALIPRTGFPVTSSRLHEVLELVKIYEKSYAVVEQSGRNEEGDIIRRVTYSSDQRAFSAVWVAAEFEFESKEKKDTKAASRSSSGKSSRSSSGKSKRDLWKGGLYKQFVMYEKKAFSRLSESDPEGMKKYPRMGCIWNEAEVSYLVDSLRKGRGFEEIAYNLGRKENEVAERVRGIYKT